MDIVCHLWKISVSKSCVPPRITRDKAGITQFEGSNDNIVYISYEMLPLAIYARLSLRERDQGNLQHNQNFPGGFLFLTSIHLPIDMRNL